MSKPATVAIGTAGVIALAVLVGAFALRDKRPPPAAPKELDPVAEPNQPAPAAAKMKYVPRLVTSLVAVPRLSPLAELDAGRLLDESSLVAKLHDLAGSDPPLSLKLARGAVDRFPDSPNAPEFEWNVVKALFNMGRLEDAKEEARIMLWKYPDSDLTIDVDRHLLHPQPNSSIAP
jgi:hypothetical protein